MGELKGKHSRLLSSTVLDICQHFSHKRKRPILNIAVNYRLNYDCERELIDYYVLNFKTNSHQKFGGHREICLGSRFSCNKLRNQKIGL